MSILVERDVPIALDDGTTLRADVYRDPDGPPAPVLLQYTAYSKANWASVNGVIGPTRAVESGFAVVVVDARGRFTSGGDAPFRPFADDGASAAACVAWAAAQPWSTGAVGMYGASNNGVPQWQSLRHGAPALRTIVPHFSASEYEEGWVYRGGAFHLGFDLWWTLANLAPDMLARARARGDLDAAAADAAGAALARALARPDEAFAHLPLGDVEPVRTLAPHYGEWLAHPPGDPAWEATSMRSRWAALDVPVLHVAGWFNVHLDGNLDNYVAARTQPSSEAVRDAQHLVVGPWTQWSPGTFGDACGPERRFVTGLDMEGLQLAWFAHHLADGPAPDLPRVRAFVMGTDEWRSLPDWPPPSAVPTAFHLRSGGGANTRAGDGVLSSDEPAADEPPDTFLYDPRHPVPSIGGAAYLPNAFANSGPRDQGVVEDRADVLVYTGEALSAPVTVLGPVTARVWLSSTAPATDVTAKLVDVHPDGRAVLLCDGITRVTLPASSGGGEPTPVDVDLAATGNTFLPGHRIRLEVSSSNFPRFARHPNTPGDPLSATAADLTPAIQTIHHTPTHPSSVTLPVLPD